MFWITFLDQLYWVVGSVVGSLLGSVVSFNTKGLDFVLTALFVGQWKETDNHIPAMIGVAVTLLCRIIFGGSSFLIPAMAGILLCLSLAKKKMPRREAL